MDDAVRVSCMLGILDGNVLLLSDLLTEIAEYECCSIRAFLAQFRDQESLEEFLQDNEDYFTVENGRVVVYDDDLDTYREDAVSYFKDVLENYAEPRPIMRLKGHIGQADQHVKYFINTFYPGKEFKNFLQDHTDVFTVFNDGTVFLIEKECVNYFSKYVEEDGTHFKSLHGHLGQAPRHVINYIKSRYPGKKFLQFFQNNCDIFRTNGLYVSLNNSDSEDSSNSSNNFFTF